MEACESEDSYTNSPKVTASSKELLMKIMQSTSAESERQVIDRPGGGRLLNKKVHLCKRISINFRKTVPRKWKPNSPGCPT